MRFNDILAEFNQASGFELYRLRMAIDQVLADPKWIVAVKRQLHIGQEIEYFDSRRNGLRRAQIIEFRSKEVLLQPLNTNEYWLIAYTAINIDGIDVQIRNTQAKGLSRNEIAVGDTLGFLDSEQTQRQGKAVRLNAKTVTLDCEGEKWRVGYEFLHRVVDGER